MKKQSVFKTKSLVFAILCIIIATAFSACSGIEMAPGEAQTELSIKSDGSGERIITCPINLAAIQSKVVGGKEALDTLINEECPSGLSVVSTSDSDYVFSVKFNSIQDYREKTTAITGLPTEITMGAANGIFASGLNYSESFTSKELLNWIYDVAQDKELFPKEYALWSYGNCTLSFNSQVYPCNQKISVNNITTNPVKKVSVNTKASDTNTFERSVGYCVANDTISKIGENKFKAYMESLVPSGATSAFTENGSDKIFTVTFFANDIKELAKKTNTCMDSQLCTVDALDSNNDIFTSNKIRENINFSAFPSSNKLLSNVEYAFEFNSNSNNNSIYTWKNGVKNDISSQINDRKTTISDVCNDLTVEIDSSETYDVLHSEINIVQNAENEFSENICIEFDPTAKEKAYSKIEKYIENQNIFGVSSDMTDTACVISISGNAQKINSANTKLFSNENKFSATKNGNFELFKKIDIVVNADFSSFFKKLNYSTDISFTFVSLYPISQAEANNQVIVSNNVATVELATTDKMTLSVKTQQMNYLFLIIMIVSGLIVIILICLLIFYIISKKKEKEYIKFLEENDDMINGEADTDDLKETGLICKSCGTPLYEGMVFCVNCGAKIETSDGENKEEIVKEGTDTPIENLEETSDQNKNTDTEPDIVESTPEPPVDAIVDTKENESNTENKTVTDTENQELLTEEVATDESFKTDTEETVVTEVSPTATEPEIKDTAQPDNLPDNQNEPISKSTTKATDTEPEKTETNNKPKKSVKKTDKPSKKNTKTDKKTEKKDTEKDNNNL